MKGFFEDDLFIFLMGSEVLDVILIFSFKGGVVLLVGEVWGGLLCGKKIGGIGGRGWDDRGIEWVVFVFNNVLGIFDLRCVMMRGVMRYGIVFKVFGFRM